HTAGFRIEPIQGEASVNIPPEGFLKEAYEICQEHNVLFIADEIQSGLGRSGKLFACDWDEVVPDIYILGKALGGGVFPISCVLANKDILGVFNPGSQDRKSTRLNSSHVSISYAVFCLKKKSDAS